MSLGNPVFIVADHQEGPSHLLAEYNLHFCSLIIR